MKLNLYVEFNGEKMSTKLIENAFKETWKEKGEKIKDLADVDLYYKPDENACYYFIPETGTSGKIQL